MKIDVAFSITSRGIIPKDHGYSLFSAISRIVPQVHQNRQANLLRVQGRPVFGNHLQLFDQSAVTLRLPAEDVETLIPLEKAVLDIGGFPIILGSPTITPLRPYKRLYSNLVVIKSTLYPKLSNSKELDLTKSQEIFKDLVRQRLTEKGVNAKSDFGEHARSVEVAHHGSLGWPVWLYPETEEDSLRAQELGLGARRHMGCGTFVGL